MVIDLVCKRVSIFTLFALVNIDPFVITVSCVSEWHLEVVEGLLLGFEIKLILDINLIHLNSLFS